MNLFTPILHPSVRKQSQNTVSLLDQVDEFYMLLLLSLVLKFRPQILGMLPPYFTPWV